MGPKFYSDTHPHSHTDAHFRVLVFFFFCEKAETRLKREKVTMEVENNKYILDRRHSEETEEQKITSK